MESLAVFAQAVHAQKVAVETAFAVVSAAQRCSREMLRGSLERYPGLPSKERESCLLFNDFCLEVTAQCRLITAQGFEGAMRLFAAPAYRQETAATQLEQHKAASAPASPATEPQVLLPAGPEVLAASAHEAAPVAPLLSGPQTALEEPAQAPLAVAAGADAETAASAVRPVKRGVANRNFTAAGKPRPAARRTRKKATVAASPQEERLLEGTEAGLGTVHKQP